MKDGVAAFPWLGPLGRIEVDAVDVRDLGNGRQRRLFGALAREESRRGRGEDEADREARMGRKGV